MYIERNFSDYFDLIKNSFDIVAIVGAKDTGKTTFLKNRPDKNIEYLLFDDIEIRGLFNQNIKKFETQYLSRDKTYIFDEVHSAEDCGRKLKYLVDTGYKIWITSSSELILRKEILSFLVGRISILRLFPFDVFEFLIAKGLKVEEQSIANRLIDEHIRFGGYPKVVLSENQEVKKNILQNIRETILIKDIAYNFNIDDIKNLEILVEYLALNVSTILNFDSVSKVLRISFPTLKKYIDALERSYIISLIRPFFRNQNKELTKQPKVFFIDNGILNQTIRNFSVTGSVFENYVFTELLKSDFTPKFWRNKQKNEVDFIIEMNQLLIPIEVKLNFHKIESGLKSFIREYKSSLAYICIYEGEEKDLILNGCQIKIRFINNMIKELKNLNKAGG